MTNTIQAPVRKLSAQSFPVLLVLLTILFASCSKRQIGREIGERGSRVIPPIMQAQITSGLWVILPETLEADGLVVPLDPSHFVVSQGELGQVGGDAVGLEDLESRLSVTLHDYANEVTGEGMKLMYSYESEEGAHIETELLGELRKDDPRCMNVWGRSTDLEGTDIRVGQWSAVFRQQ